MAENRFCSYNLLESTKFQFSGKQAIQYPVHRKVDIVKKNGYLNENQIAAMCLLPPRDANAVINKLFQEGLINKINVPSIR